MGYNTDFTGEFKFNRELVGSEIAKLQSFFGEDCREHQNWVNSAGLYHVNLEFIEDYSGIRWDGMEKTDDLTDYINMILDNINFPNFELTGRMLAQGEDIDDRYELVVENGRIKRRDIIRSGKKMVCPNCEEEFYLEDAE